MKLPKINKVKVLGVALILALTIILGRWIGDNLDVLYFAATKPEDVRATKAVREAIQEAADQQFIEELSLKK